MDKKMLNDEEVFFHKNEDHIFATVVTVFAVFIVLFMVVSVIRALW